MNDFECRYSQALHDAATQLAEDESAYHLARQLIKANERIEQLEMAAEQREQAVLMREAEHVRQYVTEDLMRDWSAMAEDFDSTNSKGHQQ